MVSDQFKAPRIARRRIHIIIRKTRYKNEDCIEAEYDDPQKTLETCEGCRLKAQRAKEEEVVEVRSHSDKKKKKWKEKSGDILGRTSDRISGRTDDKAGEGGGEEA
jgi:hypothetical protein